MFWTSFPVLSNSLHSSLWDRLLRSQVFSLRVGGGTVRKTSLCDARGFALRKRTKRSHPLCLLLSLSLSHTGHAHTLSDPSTPARLASSRAKPPLAFVGTHSLMLASGNFRAARKKARYKATTGWPVDIVPRRFPLLPCSPSLPTRRRRRRISSRDILGTLFPLNGGRE